MNSSRAFRKSGYTQKELAAILEMSEAQFSQKKHGWRGRRFSEDEIKTLALHGVPISELFPEPEVIEV